jgi:hypothetical protein
MKKMKFRGKIIPTLINSDDYNMDYLFKPGIFSNLGVLYNRVIQNKLTPLKVSDLKKYNCSFDDIIKKCNETLEKNISKIELKTSKYPHDSRIFSINGPCATSVLFTKWPENYSGYDKVVIMPVYKDFIVATKLGEVDDLIEFYRVVSSMAFSAEEQNKLLSKELFIIDPKIGKLEKFDPIKIFGSNFNLVSINAKGNIDEQLEKYSTNFSLKMLSDIEGKDEAISMLYSEDPKFLMLKNKIKGDLVSELLRNNLSKK